MTVLSTSTFCALVIPAAVDDVEVCVSSGTMKNTIWVTPKRFRRL